MTDRPIIFSAPMIRALIEGRKTQTRRLLKHRAIDINTSPSVRVDHPEWIAFDHPLGGPLTCIRWPYTVGDRLWVRESWTASMTHGWTIADARSRMFQEEIHYRADGDDSIDWWWPSIHLPREFSRLTLTVTDVRVQRLQEISEEDAHAEGATMRLECHGWHGFDPGWSMDWSKVGQPSRFAANGKALTERDVALGSPVLAFASFINELHDPRWNHKGDGIFGANPWIVALTFTVERRNIDAPGVVVPAREESV